VRQQYLVNLDANTNVLIAAGVAVVTLLILVILNKSIRNWVDKLRVGRAIKRLGTESMSNVVISDGMDGHVFIEHLVLTPAYVLVVSVRRYAGAIFAAENMEMWAQVTDGGSFKFPNPLHEVEAATLAVKSHLPGIEVKGLIVFDRESTFPKGKPAGVVHINEIVKDVGAAPHSDVPKPIREAWNKLVTLKITT
jgi:hypothetical protein